MNKKQISSYLFGIFSFFLFFSSYSFAAVPSTPTLNSAVAGTSTVTLSWSHASGATSYTVKYGKNSGRYNMTKSVGNVTNYTVTGLANGTKYYFVVVATNSSGSSGNSNEKMAQPIAAPTLSISNAGTGFVALKWTAVTGATSYTVNYGLSSGLYTVTINAETAVNLNITNLTNGTPYFFVVTANNSTGKSSYSAEKTATPLTAPILNSAVAGINIVTLSWNNVVGATSYAVRYGKNSGSYTTNKSVGNVTSSIVTKLTNGTKYYFVVEAANTNATSNVSNEKFATPSATPLTAPSLNTATPGNARVSLSWSSVSTATGYRIQYGTTSGNYGTTVDVGNVINYTVLNLTNQTAYYFIVTAYNSGGESGNSNEKNATPQLPPDTTAPSIPTGLTATAVSTTQIDLNWNASTDNVGVTGYRIYRGGNFLTSVVTTYYSNTNLIPSTNYVYTVSAVDAANNESNQSASANATTQIDSPTLQAPVPGGSQVSLSWTAVASATGYKVKYGTQSGNYPNVSDVGNVTSKTISNLINGTTYYFIVSANNASGESNASNEVNAAPQVIAAVYTTDQCNGGVSNASSCLSGCGSQYSHTKAFDNVFNVPDGWVSNNTQTGWLEYQFSSPKTIAKYTINPRSSTDGNPKSWTFEGFDQNNNQWVVLDTRVNQTWVYTVTKEFSFNNINSYSRYRLNISANGGHSEVGLTEMEMEELVSPGTSSAINDLQVSPNNGSVTLTWTAPPDGGSPITRYEVQYGTVASGQFNTILVDDALSGTIVNGLTNGTAYQFRVVAVNAYGTSNPSNVVSAMPLDGTIVSGAVNANTTWTLAGSPYHIVGNIIIGSGITLTIDPGVQVRFAGNYSIDGAGTLNAQGNAGNLITFASDTASPGSWQYVALQTPSSILNYVQIQYADRGVFIPTGAVNPTVQNSVIQNNNTGIYFEPRTGPTITNNTITNNTDGIFTGCNALSGCSPVINQNTITGNTGHNVRVFNYNSDASAKTINALNNWWGTTDGTVIESKILHFTDNNTLAHVNFSLILDGPNGNSISPVPSAPILNTAAGVNHGAKLTWSAVQNATGYKIRYGTSSGSYPTTVDVGNVLTATVSGLTVGIPYYFVVAAYNNYADSLNSNQLSATPNNTITITDTGVTNIFIDPKLNQTAVIHYSLEKDANVTIKIYNWNNQTLVRTLVNNQPRSSGANTEIFNGKNDANQSLPIGVFVYKITAADAQGGSGSYDPVFTPGIDPAVLTFTVSPLNNFSSYKGDRLDIAYTLSAPALVSLGFKGQSDFLLQQPRDTTGNADHWDGRGSNGNILTSINPSELRAKTQTLPENTIVIRNQVTVDVTVLKSDPYVIRPLYNESTRITYTINQTADVTVSILTPDGTQILKTLEQTSSQSAGTYTLTWDGTTTAGETIAEEGDYRIRVQAVSSTGGTVIRDGNIKVLY